jgi:hypothetical protein
MNPPEKCEFCGADFKRETILGACNLYDCGSTARPPFTVTRTDLCREREGRQKAEKALDKKANQLSIKECELASSECELAYSRARNKKLRDLLERLHPLADHDLHCDYREYSIGNCTCGYSQLSEQLTQLTK